MIKFYCSLVNYAMYLEAIVHKIPVVFQLPYSNKLIAP